MNTTVYQNRPEDSQNWTNLYLEPHDYWMSVFCKHWFASSVWNFCRWVADVPPRETSPVAKSEDKRMFTQASLGSVLQSKKENSGVKGGHWFPYDPLRHHACLSGMFDIDLYANELVSAQKTNSLTTIDLVHLQSAAKQSTPLALKF